MNNQMNNNNKLSIGDNKPEYSNKIKHEESNKNLKKVLIILSIFLFFLICLIFLLLIINNSNSSTHNSNNGKVSIAGVYHDEYEGTKYWGSPCYLEDDNGDKHTVSCLYNKDLSDKKLEIIGINIEPKKIPDNYEGAVAGDYWPGYIKILDYSIKGIVCVKEGEYVDHPSKNSFECCNGLSKTSALPVDDNCDATIPKNSPGIEPGWVCINCGDGKCSDKYENKCNCPEDCQTQTSQIKMIYSKESAWGPCANPKGGCWQNEYLYQDGKYEIVTMSGAKTKTLSKEAIKMITDYVKSSGLLTDTCEHSPVLDSVIYYTIRLYDKENKITFPGCKDKLDKLDKLIEINSLEILDRQKIIDKAKVNLHNWLNEKDYYQVNLDELELQHFETPVCRYNNRQPIRTGSCWSVGYPGRNIIDEINSIDDVLEKLYYTSFQIESNNQSGCGLVGGEVLITNRGRIIEIDKIELCIDG
ncbi:hypothetical protein KAI65_04080 [Candidatus Parcubacteria bacterium]|nr:hypothetical protein [Candidatus Parcubacteria bacterium]